MCYLRASVLFISFRFFTFFSFLFFFFCFVSFLTILFSFFWVSFFFVSFRYFSPCFLFVFFSFRFFSFLFVFFRFSVYRYPLLICIKGKLVFLLDKTGYVSQETTQNSIDSQNFYFHFHYKLFCIKAVHLSGKPSLMCHRLWPIEDICIGLYALKRLLDVRHILEKIMSMQHSLEEFSEKQRRVELKYVWNFVAKTVLIESVNRFSLEELCRTQYSLK